MSHKFTLSFLRNVTVLQIKGNRSGNLRSIYVPTTQPHKEIVTNICQFSSSSEFSICTTNFHQTHKWRPLSEMAAIPIGINPFSIPKPQYTGGFNSIIGNWKSFHTMTPKLSINKDTSPRKTDKVIFFLDIFRSDCV